MKRIKKYYKENIRIKITDFELLDVSIYGCDARFEFEIRDHETDILLDTGYETVEYAFMGVDDSEEIYYFLEEKGIDFSEQYDDDYDRLPDELKEEFEAHLLELYNDVYHDYLFDGDEETQKEFVDKIMKKLHLQENLFYITKDEDVSWIEATSDYFGVHLKSDSTEIRRIYNVNTEDWIYEVDGIYFDVVSDFGMFPEYTLELFERDDKHPHNVTREDLENDTYPGFHGKVGDVVFPYDDVFE